MAKVTSAIECSQTPVEKHLKLPALFLLKLTHDPTLVFIWTELKYNKRSSRRASSLNETQRRGNIYFPVPSSFPSKSLMIVSLRCLAPAYQRYTGTLPSRLSTSLLFLEYPSILSTYRVLRPGYGTRDTGTHKRLQTSAFRTHCLHIGCVLFSLDCRLLHLLPTLTRSLEPRER